jgi:hypothetical protein
LSSLTPEEIAALLKIPDAKPKAPRTGTRRAKVDILKDRSLRTWFNLAKNRKHLCQNPNCHDHTRSDDNKGKWTTILIKDQYICRYCFLAGYLNED